MRALLTRWPRLIIPIGPIRLAFGTLWLLAIPLVLWGVHDYVLPIAVPSLPAEQGWIAAFATTVVLMLSLILHALAHGLMALTTHTPLPERVPIELFGDASQVWPAAPGSGRDALIALAGPIASGLLAALSAVIWNVQLSPVVNAIAFLATVANSALAIINLLPGFPLDGGRVLRSVIWADFGAPLQAARLGRAAGCALMIGLAAWGIFLVSLNARFSIETGGATILIALLVLSGLRHPAWNWDVSPEIPPRIALNGLVGALIPGVQLTVALLMLPLVDGLYAPGPAVEVEPMVILPSERRTPASGQFLLTTVIAQTPITLGQWAYAKIEPAFTIVPPEQVVPRDTTPQQVMRQNVQMLEESEATAMVVGVRLAGFTADLTSTALQITAIAPESPSAGLLQPNDILISVGGVAIPRLDVLRGVLASYNPGDTIQLVVERAGSQQSLSVTLMAAGQPGGPPRIGVNLQPLGLDVQLPFPVKIEAKRIAGGPSAGLMFALSIYDLLIPEDLTHGQIIAGTGTIALDGTVGPIGGVAQKVAGAEWAGARYFITPREHEAEARRVAKTITIIPVSTIQEAITALTKLPTTAPDS